MDIQNKRIPEGEFQKLRQEVLTHCLPQGYARKPQVRQEVAGRKA